MHVFSESAFWREEALLHRHLTLFFQPAFELQGGRERGREARQKRMARRRGRREGGSVSMATGVERHQHCISISGNGARESKVWHRTDLDGMWSELRVRERLLAGVASCFTGADWWGGLLYLFHSLAKYNIPIHQMTYKMIFHLCFLKCAETNGFVSLRIKKYTYMLQCAWTIS